MGWRIRAGLADIVARAFGQDPTADTPARTPVLDVQEEGDRLRILAEMPGVAPDQVKVEIKGTRLTLSADGARDYRCTLDLPADLDPSARIEVGGCNGVIEITLHRSL